MHRPLSDRSIVEDITVPFRGLAIVLFLNARMDDEVIREVDVFVTDKLPLFLLQFPLKPVYADSIEITSGKFKPVHKKLELEVPLVLPENYPRESMNSTIPKSQKYQSSMVAQDACLGAAIIKDNAMYITPIQSVLQLRPSFKNMSSFKGEMIEQMEDDSPETEVNESEGGALQQVTLKRKESEKAQSTRVQSFAYLQAKEELEPWKELIINPIGKTREIIYFPHSVHSNSVLCPIRFTGVGVEVY